MTWLCCHSAQSILPAAAALQANTRSGKLLFPFREEVFKQFATWLPTINTSSVQALLIRNAIVGKPK